MSAIRLGMPGSACNEEYGRSPHSPIAYLKLLSLPASLPATAIPAATTATASAESPTARVFRIDLPPEVSCATPQWRAAQLACEFTAVPGRCGKRSGCEA